MSTSHHEPQGSSDSAVLPEFKPRCLQCRYDLIDLPDGACPECGTGFSHEALRTEFNDLQNRSGGGTTELWPFALILVVLIFACVGDVVLRSQPVAGVIWAVSAGVLFARRSSLFQSRIATLLWIAFAAGLVTASMRPTPAIYRSLVSEPISLRGMFCLSAALCAFALVLKKWRWMLWAWASLLIGMGMAICLCALPGILRNEHWGHWSDPRVGDFLYRGPMSNFSAMKSGGVAAVTGLIALLLVRRIEPHAQENPRRERTGS